MAKETASVTLDASGTGNSGEETMLNVAIVGTGNISHNHIQGYLQFDQRCRIVALVDIYPEKPTRKSTLQPDGRTRV